MIVRKAVQQDAEPIATYILLAMEEIVFQFIGEKNRKKAKEFMLRFVKEKGNQYSYEYCWILEDEGEVVAAALVYGGDELEKLRAPISAYIESVFNIKFDFEDETQAGEIYIDCVGVNPDKQGRGIGSKLFKFLIQEYVIKQKQTLGLLVDEDNPGARRLYLRMGFKAVGYKDFAGKKMEHLQFKA